ncbi:flagellar hook-basal body complex protein [Clostridium sp. UBA4548]|uniref:flagellar hook-basal body complex protein n=1 Tax=Clostridium sp. UBA4548 TaxID=1946361 RepID=UPI0025BD485E|nr:flagellar hook-basal body complex protein [Clostridium sp. UBA4548]
MIRGLYTATSGLITSEAKQNVIMNNIANANTSGYKSENISIRSFDEVMISNRDRLQGSRNVRNNIGYLSNGAEINERNTNFSQGLVKGTGISTDFAIEGEGFFVVQRSEDNGVQNYYTRDGHFNIDGNGYLVTVNGDRVMGYNNGRLEPLYVGRGDIESSKNGTISVDGITRGQVAVVNFEKVNNNYENLNKVSDNLYKGENPVMATKYSINQRSLETANVDMIKEMSDMMAVMRNFESDTKVLKALDETLGKAVNEIGTVR